MIIGRRVMNQRHRDKKYFIVGSGVTGQSFRSYLTAQDQCYESVTFGDYHIEEGLSSAMTEGIVAITPSLPPKWKEIFEQRGIEYLCDVDLFFSQVKTQNIILVTGTNGKTTTVELLAYFLKQLLPKTQTIHVGGNIGTPLLSLLSLVKPDDYVVIELSSYQLFWTQQKKSVKSLLGIITSFDEDHLQWHGSKEHYRQCKEKIIDLSLQTLVAGKAASLFANVCAVETRIKHQFLPPALLLNLDTVYAALNALGFSKQLVKKISLDSFVLSPARGQVLRQGRLRLVNDAKATNIEAVLALFETYCHKKEVLWILGGDFKGQELNRLKRFLSYPSVTLAFFGPQRQRLHSLGLKSRYEASLFQDLISLLLDDCQQGLYQTLVLSPGGTSFPEFSGYLALGRAFEEVASSTL